MEGSINRKFKMKKEDLSFRDEIVYRLLPRLITRFPIDDPKQSLDKAYRIADAFIERIKEENG